MTPESLDWPALDRLRELFLGGGAASGPYWRDARDLAAYDATYAERIGWKWDHLLAELRLRRWQPKAAAQEPDTRGLRVLDWGCGSGVAGRRVVAWLRETTAVARLDCWDHSPLARGFAVERARNAFPDLTVGEAVDGAAPDLLVLSHVANELPPPVREGLLDLVRRSGAVLWIEPGTHNDARALQRTRETLVGTHHVVAPCTHDGPCGLLASGRERDWCHHFARPPGHVFTDGAWVRFAQRAGIDLRSLPYACLVLEAQAMRERGVGDNNADGEEVARVIGRPEIFKPYARVLACAASGALDLEVPRRTCRALYKALDRPRGPLLYRWRHDGTHVTDGGPLFANTADSDDPAPPPSPD